MTTPTKDEIFLTQIGDLQSKTGDTYNNLDLVYNLLKTIASTQSDIYEYTELKFALNFWLSRLNFDELKIVGTFLTKPLLQGSNASGQVLLLGNINAQIPAESILVNNNNQYIIQNAAIITTNTFSILSISRIGTLATAITSQPHTLATGTTITIFGFTESNFNKTTSINVISDISFTYIVSNTGATSDINGSFTYNGCIVNVQANIVGVDQDLQNGATMTFEPEDSNVAAALVTFYGITGGSDIETQTEYYLRLQNEIINNLPKDSDAKIISTIIEKFPVVTKGKVVKKYTASIGVASITKDSLLNNNFQRKITCKTPHLLRDLTFFKSITGANSAALNISDQLTNNRAISKIYDALSFAINVENTTSEDSSSPNMQINFSGFKTAIVLYKGESQIKTLNASELQEIRQYLTTEINNFTITQDSFYVLSATEIIQSLTVTILPKIATLQNTVKNNIYDYVLQQAQIGGLIRKNTIDTIINNSIDDNGNTIANFSTNMIGDWTTGSEVEIISLPKENITVN